MTAYFAEPEHDEDWRSTRVWPTQPERLLKFQGQKLPLSMAPRGLWAV